MLATDLSDTTCYVKNKLMTKRWEGKRLKKTICLTQKCFLCVQHSSTGDLFPLGNVYDWP